MNEFDIPLFKKIYEFYKEFYLVLKNFPKQERYSLGARCEDTILGVFAYVISASRVSKERRVELLESAIGELSMVQMYIRLAKDLHAIDTKKYIFFEERVIEIGKMLGGWLRTTRASN